jgi:hypothetical protein
VTVISAHPRRTRVFALFGAAWGRQRRRRIRWAAALLSAALLVAAVAFYGAFWRGGGSARGLSLSRQAAAASVSPEALVLDLAELPAGFSASGGQYLLLASLARQSGVSIARYRAWGYEKAYEGVFSTESGAAGMGSGPLGISSYAFVYRTAAGARASLLSLYRQCPKSHGTSRGKYVPMSGRIGDQSFVCAFSSVKLATPEYDVSWRHGTVEGLIVLAGQSPQPVSAANAVALARTQDAKDEAALRR